MYDDIAQGYREIVRDVTMPLHTAELYTFAQLIGDVRGKTVLDLGCGEGFYSRRLRELGAAAVVGVDISAGMVALAQGAEEAAGPGNGGTIEYRVADVRTAGRLGEFDLVMLVLYAQPCARPRGPAGDVPGDCGESEARRPLFRL